MDRRRGCADFSKRERGRKGEEGRRTTRGTRRDERRGKGKRKEKRGEEKRERS